MYAVKELLTQAERMIGNACGLCAFFSLLGRQDFMPWQKHMVTLRKSVDTRL
jgi:hypothetical protein